MYNLRVFQDIQSSPHSMLVRGEGKKNSTKPYLNLSLMLPGAMLLCAGFAVLELCPNVVLYCKVSLPRVD